jgi:DnaA-homolog protein
MAFQVPLDFQFQSIHNFASYFSANNGETLVHLHAFLQSSGEQQIYLWGERGLGKTHLLQASCTEAGKFNKTPFYLSFRSQSLPDPASLEGLEEIDLVCLDDIELIAGQPLWERALFNFYNRHRENNKQLLISANTPPQFLPLQLPDLKTRMSWGLTLKLQSLNDEQLIQALDHKAQALGFDIPVHIGKFLLTHYQRDLPSLWRLLTKIDQATLAAKRKLTIPFLKQIITNNDE